MLLARSLGIGGAEGQIVILAKGFHGQGHDVAVVTFYGAGSLGSELVESGIPVVDLHKFGRWDLLPLFIRAARAVRKLKPQIIYGFLGTPNIATVFLKPMFPRTAIVWGVRASYVDLARYDWLTRLSYQIERKLARFADLIICNSHAGLEYAATHGFPRENMTVVANGVDPDRFKPDAVARLRTRQEWSIRADELLLGLVGRIDPMKDYPTFLAAAAMLASENPNVRFVCVGEGPASYVAKLQALGRELGLDDRLTWAGERSDMPGVYNALDVAVSSSYGEGFSNVIVEAMACGVPCVVTDVGDSALIVGDTGVVVPAVQPDALYAGCRQMLDRLSPSLCSAAREAIVSRFTNGVLVAETMRAFSRVTQAH